MMGRSIRIARSWDKRPPRGGIAVVIDVMRFSTTLCALLAAGRRTVRVALGPDQLRGARGIERADVFSELRFACPGRRRDNSPHQALRSAARDTPAYSTTTTGARAAFQSRSARRVLIGCFANFSALLRVLRRSRGAVCLVPAASPTPHPGRVEDEACAAAFKAALSGARGAGPRAVAAVRASGRPAQFLRERPRWGKKDLPLCLGLDRWLHVPELRFSASSPGLARVRDAS